MNIGKMVKKMFISSGEILNLNSYYLVPLASIILYKAQEIFMTVSQKLNNSQCKKQGNGKEYSHSNWKLYLKSCLGPLHMQRLPLPDYRVFLLWILYEYFPRTSNSFSKGNIRKWISWFIFEKLWLRRARC